VDPYLTSLLRASNGRRNRPGRIKISTPSARSCAWSKWRLHLFLSPWLMLHAPRARLMSALLQGVRSSLTRLGTCLLSQAQAPHTSNHKLWLLCISGRIYSTTTTQFQTGTSLAPPSPALCCTPQDHLDFPVGFAIPSCLYKSRPLGLILGTSKGQHTPHPSCRPHDLALIQRPII
jgi:hypothetical protein